MKSKEIINDTMQLNNNAIAYSIGQRLTAVYPNNAILETTDCSFDIEQYAGAGKCQLTPNTAIYSQFITYWHAPTNQSYSNAGNACLNVAWEGHELTVFILNWSAGYSDIRSFWLIGDTQEIVDGFFSTVCQWNTEIRKEILVFSQGGWRKSAALYESIQGSTLEDLILEGDLKENIRQDLSNFFNAASQYKEYDIPWKRGVIFIGPPGNGKTLLIKALINDLKLPCLYVKSFKSRYAEPEENINRVFRRARQASPCIIVFEDIDSLIDSKTRSFFLNELDGFANNEGILTLATTNHPERLDVAIIDRPSRFDRKYHFNLPKLRERQAYIDQWNNKLSTQLRLSDEVITQIVQSIDGFSFAYIKELLLSAMVAWMNQEQKQSMEQMVLNCIPMLKEQMNSALKNKEGPPAFNDEGQDDEDEDEDEDEM